MSEQVVIYSRFSTDRQDARSIEDQERRCREFAAARGFTVAGCYSDAAISGSHTHRPGLSKMRGALAKRSAVRAVLVDDLSRLSRDLGNIWRIIFEELAAASVRVIDCHTGMASDAAGARLTFGALALVNDTFLQLVKTETHRGLEGRALAGFSTGGRVYGYSTRPEENPPDPEHPRAVFEIEASEAVIVRRIFSEFLAGRGLASIARQLNAEGHRAPYDGTYSKKAGRGWAASTIRNLLRNERYIGRLVWNKRKFIRVPGAANRRAVQRPRAEWKTQERPELAIVDAQTWEATQKRFEARGPRLCRKAGTVQHPTLLSGLLRCGVCGASMSMCCAKVKNGVRYTNYRCAAFMTKGASVCPNNAQISEKRIRDALLAAIQEALSDQAIERITAAFTRRVSQGNGVASGFDDLRRRLTESQQIVANLTDALGRVGFSEALAARLAEEESRARVLRAQLAEMEGARSRAREPAGADVLAGYMRNLRANVTANGGAALRPMLGDGLRMVPKTEGAVSIYEAHGALRFPVSDNDHCGGRIVPLSLPAQPLVFRVIRGRAA